MAPENAGTLGSPATSEGAIAVGVHATKFRWDATDGNTYHAPESYEDFGNIARFSSRGPTRDGRIIVAVGNDAQFAAFAEATGKADWARDPRYATNPARVANREQLTSMIATIFKTRTSEDWLAVLAAADVPAGPIIGGLLNSLAQVATMKPARTERNGGLRGAGRRPPERRVLREDIRDRLIDDILNATTRPIMTSHTGVRRCAVCETDCVHVLRCCSLL